MASLAASARSVARSLDAFPKVGDDFVVRTRLGGAVTLACALACGALFLSEAHYHLSRTQRTSLTVDSGRDAWAEKLHVELNVTFHAVPCELVSLEALDSSGDFVLDLMASHVHKWDVDTASRRVGDAQRGRANERGGGDGGGVSGGDAAEGGRAGGGGTEGGGAGSTPGAHATPGHSTIAEFMREAFHWNRGGKAGGGGGGGRSPADEEREHAARAAAKLAGGGGSSSGGGGGREDDGTEGEEVALGAAGSRRLLARDLGGGGGGSALEIRQSMLQVDFMGELLESMGKVQADVDRMKREGGSVVGCHMEGYMEVSKLSGHIQVNPGRTLSLSNGQIVQMQLDPAGFNMSHTIHGLSFGAAYPGKVEPLSGARRVHAASGLATQYFLKVVPTTYHRGGRDTHTNQYSYTETTSTGGSSVAALMGGGDGKKAGVYFHYEIWPIRVHVVDSRSSLAEFLTSVCAIVGGTVAIAGMAAGVGNAAAGNSRLVEASKAVLGRA